MSATTTCLIILAMVSRHSLRLEPKSLFLISYLGNLDAHSIVLVSEFVCGFRIEKCHRKEGIETQQDPTRPSWAQKFLHVPHYLFVGKICIY